MLYYGTCSVHAPLNIMIIIIITIMIEMMAIDYNDDPLLITHEVCSDLLCDHDYHNYAHHCFRPK